jgi:acyl-coenzyme A synthetase/AMP-(fatty) acid ligase
VTDAALMTVPNSAGVDELATALVLGPGADVPAIHRRIGMVTAPHAASVQVHLVPSVPRIESGKLRRPEIRRLVLIIRG